MKRVCGSRLAIIGFSVALLFVFTLTITPVGADSACEDACFDTFDAQVQECDDDLAQTQAQNDLDEQACFDDHNGDPQQLDQCLKQVSIKRRNAIKKNQQCIHNAARELERCLAACDPSPATTL